MMEPSEPLDAGEVAALRRLLDRQAITDLVYERGRTLDRRDVPGQIACYVPGGVHVYAGFEGTIEEFLTSVSPANAGTSRMTTCLHYLTNVRVDFDGRDRARAHSQHLATITMTSPDGDTDWLIAGRDFDWVVRTGGEWLIERRETVFDWSHSAPSPARWWTTAPQGPSLLVGAPDRSDPFFDRYVVSPGPF